MKIEEARKFIAVLMVTYPNYNPIDEELAAETWASITEEYSYKQVDAALKIYMKTSTSGFPPVPGQIIDKIYNMNFPQELNEMEAWALVSKALRNSGYNSMEEFAKLPPIVQKAIGSPDQLWIWAIDENYNEMVAMSNFQRAYNMELKRHEEFQKVPNNLRDLISNAYENSYFDRIQQKRNEVIESTSDIKNSKIKDLEMQHDGIPMPDRCKKKIEKIKNEN